MTTYDELHKQFAEMTNKERKAWRRQYDARMRRLRQAYRTAVAGNRVALTGGATVTGTETDLKNLRDGKTVLVGRVDQDDVFHPESYLANEKNFVSAMYWQNIDVLSF